MQEQEKLSDVTTFLELRYRQAEVINAVQVPFSERFWLAEEKFSIWFLPTLALAAHFWFLCFLDWYYDLGLAMALHITNSDVLELTFCFTFMWVIFAPCIAAASLGIASMNNDWPRQRKEYLKRLEKAINKANSLWDAQYGSEYTTVREYKASLHRHLRMVMGSELPPSEEVLNPRPVNNPHIITLEMLGVEQEELRGASCLMPKI